MGYYYYHILLLCLYLCFLFLVAYRDAGYDLTNLIEPADGFHPSQTGNAVLAKAFWEWMEANHPEALGAQNPFNDEMDSLFFN